MVAEKPPLCSSDQAGVGLCGLCLELTMSSEGLGFVSVCSTWNLAWGLNQVCLEFAGSSWTAPIKHEEEQPIAWKKAECKHC